MYVHGASVCGITAFEIDIESGKRLSEERMVWRGTGGAYPEGPHAYKINDWYYLVISEGGTFDNHMVTMARSRDIWGPFEECPNNPILTTYGTDSYIQHAGHCDIFQDGNGRWLGVCLGVRKDSAGRFVMGRETFLVTGTWDGDWLSFDPIRSNPEGFTPKNGQATPLADADVGFLYIRDADMSKYQIVRGGATVRLIPSTVDLCHPQLSPAFTGRRQRLLEGRSTVSIKHIPGSWASTNLKTGLACYKDEICFVQIFYAASHSAIVFELINKAKNLLRKHTRLVKVTSKLV